MILIFSGQEISVIIKEEELEPSIRENATAGGGETPVETQ
jgi:hypothetical protein